MLLSQRQVLSQVLEQKLSLQQLLEQKQEMILQLQLLLPEDFTDFITFEDDEDIDLLTESFPFLILHEANHPIYSKGLLYIPELSLPDEVHAAVTENSYFSALNSHAVEIGIDRGAILVGQETCEYSLQELIKAHASITERVFRDVFQEERSSPNYCFIGRLDAALRLHYSLVQDDSIKERISALQKQASEYISETIPDSQDLYNAVVDEYARIYQGTKLCPDNSNNSKKIVQGFAVLQQ